MVDESERAAWPLHRKRFMQSYTGIDLHSSNSYPAIIDENRNRVFKRKSTYDVPFAS